MAEVVLDNVVKIYQRKGGILRRGDEQDVLAVDHLNLTIRGGEFLALLGPSGCGKTSTLRMIAGLEDITDGEIRIGGQRINELEPKDRGVGLAFETYALYPPLTVRDNIAFCLKARGLPPAEIERRVDEVARSVDVAEFLDRYPGELGSGEKQRVSLARALVRNPRVFLMDEPLSHLDAVHRAMMRTELKRLHTKIGTTTVLVTHDQLEAIAMADRVAVMNHGVLQQVGTAAEIYDHPSNEFVADFVGEPPINFLECVIVSRDGVPVLLGKDSSFELPVPTKHRPKVLKAKSQQAKLGIRPLDIRMSFEQLAVEPDRTGITGRVSTYESLGEEGLLSVRVGSHFVMVVTPPSLDIAPDAQVWMDFPNDRMHLFCEETGVSLL